MGNSSLLATILPYLFIDHITPPLYIAQAMAIYAVRRGSESNDRLMNRFKKQVQATRFMKTMRERSRFKKHPSRRLLRLRALKREEYRTKNKKQKFYSNM